MTRRDRPTKRAVARFYLSTFYAAVGLLLIVWGSPIGLLVILLTAAWQFDRPIETIYVPGVSNDLSTPTVPYPPVFRDWRSGEVDRRISTALATAAVEVSLFDLDVFGPHAWFPIELTEEDACLLAVSILQRVGQMKAAEDDDRFARLADETLRRLGWLI